MSSSFIQKLYTTGELLVNKSINLIGGLTSSNTILPIRTDNHGNVGISIDTATPGADSFGRFRTSLPRGVFTLDHRFDKQPFLMDEKRTVPASMSSTHLPAEAAVSLQVNSGVTSGNSNVRQSFQYIPYQPGRSQSILLTGVFGTATANANKHIGYGDASDGIFFRQQGNGTLGIVLRSSVSGSVVDTVVDQSNWNLDKLDGTGNSGFNLNVQYSQIFVIDFAWLGVGTIRLGVDTGVQGIVYCHTIYNQNIRNSVYMRAGSLPVRYDITTTGTLASNATLKCICSAVFSEGGYDRNGIPGATNTQILDGASESISTGNTELLLSIRLKSSYNRALFLPQGFYTTCTSSSDSFETRLVLGGTVTGGGTPTVTSVSDCIEAVHSRSSASVSGGKVLGTIVTAGNGDQRGVIGLDSELLVGSNIDGTSQEVHVLVTAFSLGSFYSGINWVEFY